MNYYSFCRLKNILVGCRSQIYNSSEPKVKFYFGKI